MQLHDGGPRLEETKRIARVLRILQLISSWPRQWSRARLADEFEVSHRTIDNDLQLIRHALLYDLQRSHNGYYLVDGPSTPALHLAIPETLALVLAAQLARDSGAVDPSTIAGALAHLESVLPPSIIPYLRQMNTGRNRTAFGPIHERGSLLATLEQAIIDGRKVAIGYRSASRHGELTERTIAPYHLMPYERSWQIIADDSLRGEVRMFKVDRIHHCVLTDERYAIPADFDLSAYLGPTWGVLRGEGGTSEEVVLDFSAQAAEWVRDEQWHRSQQTERRPDGSLVMRFNCSITHELVRWILSHGAQVYVQQPAHLREAVVTEAHWIAGGALRKPGSYLQDGLIDEEKLSHLHRPAGIEPGDTHGVD
jgi:predicted DNA-binding transcriptional regulator YafY